MIRTATGHPIRAVSLVALLAGLATMYRLPGLEREFAAMAQWPAVRSPTAASAAAPTAAPTSGPAAVTARRHPQPPTPGHFTRERAPGLASHPLPPRRRAAGATLSADLPTAAAAMKVAAPALPAPPGATGDGLTPGDLAGAAYARLAAGDRRAAAGLFAAALAAGPDPRRAGWQADADALGRRWSGEAYVLFRGPGSGPPGPTARPVLGGGQLGAGLAWTLDPLARRPIAAIARINAAMPGRIDRDSTQAAVGVRWQPFPAVGITAERLIAIGPAAIDNWGLRVAAGTDGARGRLEWHGYAEADLIGNGDLYAGAQARVGRRLATIGSAGIAATAGAWASTQITGRNLSRVDLGPGVVAHAALGRARIDIAADWRFRVAGNAAPENGPVVTVSTGF